MYMKQKPSSIVTQAIRIVITYSMFSHENKLWYIYSLWQVQQKANRRKCFSL